MLFHKTPYYNKAVRANEKLKAVILPIIDKHHVDLVINGHDHGYSRTYPIYQDSFVAGPADGTVYVVAGRSGKKFYIDLSAKVWDAFFHDPQAEPNYLALEVNGDQMVMQAYTQSGELIDRYVIDKARGIDIPRTSLPERSNDTRLVIWGNMLQTPLINVVPQKVSDAWYVPLRPFFEFVGGVVVAGNAGQVVVDYDKMKMAFQVNNQLVTVNNQIFSLQHPLTNIKGSTMIAAADLENLTGFGYKYDDKMNMLLIAK